MGCCECRAFSIKPALMDAAYCYSQLGGVGFPGRKIGSWTHQEPQGNCKGKPKPFIFLGLQDSQDIWLKYITLSSTIFILMFFVVYKNHGMDYFLVLLIILFLILFIKTKQNYDFRESKETIHRHLINFYVILCFKISLMFLLKSSTVDP